MPIVFRFVRFDVRLKCFIRKHFPVVILDNMFSVDFGKVIKKIDKNKKSDHMYLAPSGEYEPWDYRDFDIEAMNRTLKDNIESVQAGYEG